MSLYSSKKTNRYRVLGLLLFLFGFGQIAAAQITIAPTMMFIDSQSRFGTFLVMNGSDETQEISIEFLFGYPGINESGNYEMIYDDPAAAKKYSIADQIRGFPRNFTLAPGQRQVVRLTIRGVNELEPGVYWSRIKTISNPQAVAIGETEEDVISANIRFKFEQISTVFFTNGDVATNINFKDLSAEVNGSNVAITSQVEQTGNAPFLGSIFFNIWDNNGNKVKESRISSSCYFNAIHSQSFAINDLPEGTYTAEVTYQPGRPDISEDNIFNGESVSRKTNFTIR